MQGSKKGNKKKEKAYRLKRRQWYFRGVFHSAAQVSEVLSSTQPSTRPQCHTLGVHPSHPRRSRLSQPRAPEPSIGGVPRLATWVPEVLSELCPTQHKAPAPYFRGAPQPAAWVLEDLSSAQPSIPVHYIGGVPGQSCTSQRFWALPSPAQGHVAILWEWALVCSMGPGILGLSPTKHKAQVTVWSALTNLPSLGQSSRAETVQKSCTPFFCSEEPRHLLIPPVSVRSIYDLISLSWVIKETIKTTEQNAASDLYPTKNKPKRHWHGRLWKSHN